MIQPRRWHLRAESNFTGAKWTSSWLPVCRCSRYKVPYVVPELSSSQLCHLWPKSDLHASQSCIWSSCSNDGYGAFNAMFSNSFGSGPSFVLGLLKRLPWFCQSTSDQKCVENFSKEAIICKQKLQFCNLCRSSESTTKGPTVESLYSCLELFQNQPWELGVY